MPAASLVSKPLLVSLLTLICITPNLFAQTDPGPRPMGTIPFPPAICPIIQGGGGPFKFGGSGDTFSDCVDIDQPPPPAGSQFPNAGAGQLISVAGNLATMWGQAMEVFETPAIVTPPAVSTAPPTSIFGLGPSLNALSCSGCHFQPAVGGASPGIITFPVDYQTTNFLNPEIEAQTAAGTNSAPCFLTSNGCGTVSLGDFSKLDFQFGPVEEVRFVQATPGNATLNIDPVRAGSVANLFTIQGNSAAPNCNIGQEPVSGQIDSAFNAIFRTPTPTFGLGLVENTPDLTLETSAAAFPNRKSALGIIPGVFNISGNDGSITRFGWKAQNKSLLIFAGEALNVEMGVTNELFPNERTNGDGGCPVVNAATTYPEDEVLATNPGTLSSSVATQIASTISSVAENDAVFMRLNSPPSQCDYQSGTTGTPPNTVAACKTLSANALIGQCLFGLIGATTAVNCPSVTGIPNLPSTGIGCVLCHQDTLTTANSSQNPGLNNVQYAPYSDFALHNMGTADADGVSQGGLPAGPQQFRTAPLWGVGQRIFLMHDGRYTDIGHAVKNHCPTATPTSPGADSTDEACGVIENYLQLGTMASGTALQTDLLEFLRSL